MEDCGVLLQEVRKGLCIGLRLDRSDLAQPAGLVLGQVPVDLADLGSGQGGDAAGASSVVSWVAAVHVGEDEVLGSSGRLYILRSWCSGRRLGDGGLGGDGCLVSERQGG